MLVNSISTTRYQFDVFVNAASTGIFPAIPEEEVDLSE